MLGQFTNAVLVMIILAVTPCECDLPLYLLWSYLKTNVAILGFEFALLFTSKEGNGFTVRQVEDLIVNADHSKMNSVV